ncbi:hypothetical protein KQ939_00545 [Planococcus sp. CP5-4]|uniref:hypothetical protein n=1 Tax=unclassified Planococcus (in: firmicutes) TaxID=2662419 RepID=UPI001C21D7C1|nr:MULTISPECIES: hypothetical protein [unclassified Planococcus (in: firmicutes)]MBU9673355.1 hypothetical protein [Planococcus sp. CP5-4_YE]MBV0908128.1 hypothetical protein [Planococcus sp. CP5-4_UN]MBW6062189.1 hypothetical protein [Planococcus sp. CP5-4]
MLINKKSLTAVLFIAVLLLSACNNSVYDEMEVDENNIPHFIETERFEGANKSLIVVKLTTEGSGEEAAKKSIANSFALLKEEYRAVSVELEDADQGNWYGIYLQDDTAIQNIQHSTTKLTREEKAIMNCYEGLENKEFPIVEFSVNPILQ